jgi:hypothetical protein
VRIRLTMRNGSPKGAESSIKAKRASAAAPTGDFARTDYYQSRLAGVSDVESRAGLMPELSRFFGIVIRMFYSDHEPAHFHAFYGEYEALIEIQTLIVLRGFLPRRALALVREWASLHETELVADWQRARGGEVLTPIEPLE